MNKIMVLMILSLLTFVGCSTTNVIDRTEHESRSAYLSISKFNQEVQGRLVIVHLTNGHQYNATNIFLSQDSTEYQDAQTFNRLSANNDSIQRFECKDHLGGALDGSLLALIPAVIVSIPWYGIGGEEHSGIPIQASTLIIVGGFSIGLATGHRNYYEFSPGDRTSQNASEINLRVSTAHNTPNNDVGK